MMSRELTLLTESSSSSNGSLSSLNTINTNFIEETPRNSNNRGLVSTEDKCLTMISSFYFDNDHVKNENKLDPNNNNVKTLNYIKLERNDSQDELDETDRYEGFNENNQLFILEKVKINFK